MRTVQCQVDAVGVDQVLDCFPQIRGNLGDTVHEGTSCGRPAQVG